MDKPSKFGTLWFKTDAESACFCCRITSTILVVAFLGACKIAPCQMITVLFHDTMLLLLSSFLSYHITSILFYYIIYIYVHILMILYREHHYFVLHHPSIWCPGCSRRCAAFSQLFGSASFSRWQRPGSGAWRQWPGLEKIEVFQDSLSMNFEEF